MDAGWCPAVLPPGETPLAYGEVVWSWRRDRGVYPPRPCGVGNGDNKRRSPGRARISRKAIARGKSAWSASPVVLCPCAPACGMPACFGARDLRVHSAPGFPCALCGQRDDRIPTARTELCRENAKARLYLRRHSGACEARARKSITTIVSMDSGPAPRGASRNDGGWFAAMLLAKANSGEKHVSHQ